MRLICPACGATASAEAWANDPVMRECLRMLTADLPPAVAGRVLGYLALFRTGTRALNWSRAKTLIVQIRELVTSDTISWDRKRVLKNDPRAWAEAIDTIVLHPPRNLPLTSHNYWRKIAYQCAERLDVQREKTHNARVTQKRRSEASEGGGEITYEDFVKKFKGEKL